ncbi:peptidoglycan-binding domain-containing protein [Actinoplanes sp. NPDC026670]|uniref:peptidoglycan-binding domain-containing protein n=1 Tax=Actinoplanes sp. NPDC026670 TaxID=3154700 RepID=UPI00340B589C
MRARVGALVVVVLFAATGCADDADDRRLANKQEALAEAQAELATQVAAFCGASTSYVTALDRYGDLINATTPTVGDVKDAGADLAEPRGDVADAAEKVARARDAVAVAEKDLTEARAGASLTPAASPLNTPSIQASVSGAAISRVRQADADFTAAQQGITDKTPLRQASEQFNAAAVALEMSWLSLLTEGGCLTEDQRGRARDYTLAVQKSLAQAGYYTKEVDGVYGPTTVAAVQELQKAHGLPITGTVDKATDAALQADLRSKGGAAADEVIASTAAVQQTLKLAGFWDGPVDGAWTDELTSALMKFQKSLGVEPTGAVDAATVAAVEKAFSKPAANPEPSPVPSRS